MRFGLLSQWFDPEPGPAALPGNLARGLRDRGHHVTVVTGFPNYPTGQLAQGYRIRPRRVEDCDGIRLVRTALYPSHRPSASSRMLTYGSFGLSSLVLGVPNFRGLDAVWVNYSPVTLAPSMLTTNFALGVPAVCHVLDLWPDTLAASGVSEERLVGRVAMGTTSLAARAMYRSAHTVAYISPSVGETLAGRGVAREKLAYVPMWANEEVFHVGAAPMRGELGLAEGDVVLVYAGSLGHAQGLQNLLEACARVSDQRFVCLIAGSGTAEPELRQQASTLHLNNVRFVGRLPPDQMSNLLASADAAFIGLNEHPLARMTMPSKTQATLAAGCPLLVAGSGDVADVVRASGAGWTVPSGDPAALAQAIDQICATSHGDLKRLGMKARAYYEENFALSTGVDRLEALLGEAAGERKKP